MLRRQLWVKQTLGKPSMVVKEEKNPSLLLFFLNCGKVRSFSNRIITDNSNENAYIYYTKCFVLFLLTINELNWF